MKPVFVGEVNPYGVDPRCALFPYPNASGARLVDILNLTHREYLRAFERVNLCTGKWALSAARERASALAASDQPLILLGAKVCSAFGMKFFPFDWRPAMLSAAPEIGRPPTLTLPHPSGLNRLWNDPATPSMARRVLREFLEACRAR